MDVNKHVRAICAPKSVFFSPKHAEVTCLFFLQEISIIMGKLHKTRITRRNPSRSNVFKIELMNNCPKVDKDVLSSNAAENEATTNQHLEASVKKFSMDKQQPTSSSSTTKKKNFTKNLPKKKFYDKCAEKRLEKGLLILPKNIENRIYKLKTVLRKKGVQSEEIKQIIRKKRREAELKLRKDLKQLCFQCRQPGHELADCPLKSGVDHVANICYCCGSTEHKLSDCSKYRASKKNDKNLPYAKCFICHKLGHLTRSCSSNEHGIFPKGGNCRLCNSVNHLSKDCPKSTEQEEEIFLNTIGDNDFGVDADDFQIKSHTTNKIKVVKF